jgi:sulfite reductase (ferredoxin)
MPRFQVPDHLGWHEQGDGKLYLGLPISSGRIVDDGHSQLRTALREIVAEYGVDPILMPSQDIILSEVNPADRDAITTKLRAAGVRFGEDMVPAARWALACPALPTCGLALTEAERVSDSLIGEIVERMARWGVERERVSIRITGCPNGCARPYSGDIGIVGRIPGFYSIYVGGDFEGTRLNEVVAERIRLDEVADVLDPLFQIYATGRAKDEGFGDFCHRVGVAELREVVAGSRAKVKDAAD